MNNERGYRNLGIVLVACMLCVATVQNARAETSERVSFSDRNTVLESDLLINIHNRDITSLDGTWDAIKDPFQDGYYTYHYKPKSSGYFMNMRNTEPHHRWEYDFEQSEQLHVPGDWNSQMDKLLWYEGTIWYKKDFKWDVQEDKRVFLHFDAVNYDARIWVNREEVGRHIGGYTAFNFEVTDFLSDGDNFVILMVDNTRRREAVPTVLYDWWNYGGITRSVNLVETEQIFIQDYFVQLAPGSMDRIQGWVRINGSQASQPVTLSIPEAGMEVKVQTDADGFAEFTADVDLELWSPENPKRYEVHLTSPDDHITDIIGFRSIETRGEEIFLNGEPLFLRGINIHEEAPYRTGRANNREDARILLDWAEELGCNFIRFAHYPHSEIMVQEADRRGIMIWSEVPVYWAIQWENPETFENARNQLSEMIHRDKNRASVVLWSLSNETPISDQRNDFLRSLSERARALDPSRLLTSASDQMTFDREQDMYRIDDPIGEFVDVIGMNNYRGWFGGSLETMGQVKWESDFNKPVIYSEFGAAAKQGFHSEINQRWSEEFQAYLYSQTFKMLETMPFLQGVSPWILMDFRTPRRSLPRINDYWSRAGLVSDQGLKKEAFYTLQEWYRQIEAGEITFGYD